MIDADFISFQLLS